MSSMQMRAKELFEKYDADGSGFISLSEFRSMLPSLGINLSIPKSLEYFRLCDPDKSGQIDFEEFKVALFVCDSEDMNPSAFNPGNMLRPKDAFQMFDKDSSGQIDTDEFHFVMKFLGIEMDESTHEKMFSKYDRDGSGFIDYTEFRNVWLRLVDPKKELEDRGIHIPTLSTKSQLVRLLDEVLEDEEKREAVAIHEAKKFREQQILLRKRRNGIEKALNRSYQELCAALDCGGQVYCFGNGTLNQFISPNMEKSQAIFQEIIYDDSHELLAKLWNRRIRGTHQRSIADANGEPGVRSKTFPCEGLSIQENTVSLWGKNVINVTIGDSTILAHTAAGEVFSWGGNNPWWHEIETESHVQHEVRNPQLTARSSLMQGRASCVKDKNLLSNHNIAVPEQLFCDSSDPAPILLTKSVHGDQHSTIKRVLQYYSVWSTPKEAGQHDHAVRSVQNLVTQERLQLSLQIREKSCEGITKMEMINILYQLLNEEHQLLGEVTHLHLRELEREIFELRSKRKLKLAKRRQVEFANRRRAIKVSGYKNTKNEVHPSKSLQTKPLASSVNIASSLVCPSTKCWKMIASGANHTGLLDDNGQLYMYGLNTDGRLGFSNRNSINNGIYDQEDVHQPTPLKLKDSTNISYISCGHSHTAAISNGHVFTWGTNTAGKLGLGDIITNALSPQKVLIPRDKVTVVSCGSNHTACVSESGNLFVWGCNSAGKLGLGDFIDRNRPNIVDSLSSVAIVDVSCGFAQTLAITSIQKHKTIVNSSEVENINGGELYVAGQGTCLGSTFKTFGKYKSFLKQNMPIPPKPMCKISAGFTHQAAVAADGELFVWGDNRSGCSCQPYPSVSFIPKPMHVDSLYNVPINLGVNKPSHRSSPYGDQPFYEIDLQEQSTIQEIVLWNKLEEPKNPAILKENHTGRLFPCWIMISQKPYPSSAGEGALRKALKMSVVYKRFTANIHCSTWHPPRKTMGRFVRIQLEKMEMLEFDKLEILGNVGVDNSTARVSSVSCRKQVTTVVIRATDNIDDINLAYKRSILADRSNEKILNQFDIYKNVFDTTIARQDRNLLQNVKSENHELRVVEGITNFSIAGTDCILCTGEELCEKCKLQNDYRDILASHAHRMGNDYSLQEISSVLLDATFVQKVEPTGTPSPQTCG